MTVNRKHVALVVLGAAALATNPASGVLSPFGKAAAFINGNVLRGLRGLQDVFAGAGGRGGTIPPDIGAGAKMGAAGAQAVELGDTVADYFGMHGGEP